jgi:hypothetical protein
MYIYIYIYISTRAIVSFVLWFAVTKTIFCAAVQTERETSPTTDCRKVAVESECWNRFPRAPAAPGTWISLTLQLGHVTVGCVPQNVASLRPRHQILTSRIEPRWHPPVDPVLAVVGFVAGIARQPRCVPPVPPTIGPQRKRIERHQPVHEVALAFVVDGSDTVSPVWDPRQNHTATIHHNHIVGDQVTIGASPGKSRVRNYAPALAVQRPRPPHLPFIWRWPTPVHIALPPARQHHGP